MTRLSAMIGIVGAVAALLSGLWLGSALRPGDDVELQPRGARLVVSRPAG